jgi:hypothetical protein
MEVSIIPPLPLVAADISSKHMDKRDRLSFEGRRARGFVPRPASAKLFDSQHSPSTTTRIYDPRTHVFRSKKRNPLSAPGRHGAQDQGTNSSAAVLGNDLGTRPAQPRRICESKPVLLSASEGLHTHLSCYIAAKMTQSSSPSEFAPERYHEPQPPGSFSAYDHFTECDPSLLLQPETRPISQEQLVNEVKGIYAGLVMVEKKCVEIDNQQAQNQAKGRIIKLSYEQWQALIVLYRTLLHEHYDFFLAS